MSPHTTELLYRLANVTLAMASLFVAALIGRGMLLRGPRRPGPLAVAFCALFVSVALRAAVRAGNPGPEITTLIVTVDWTTALATLAFLLLRRRYAVFLEDAETVREYETGYAEKEREARGLAQVNDELRRLDELKSEFLAMVSHELRTPLTAIVGYSRLLMRQVHGPLTTKQLEHQEAIFRGAQRLTNLINDLLDVSRLEAGRIELQPRPTDLKRATDQVIGVVSVAARGKQLSIINAIPPDLPRARVDPSRLQQILANLLGNAVKFTPSGGTVRVQGGRHGEQVWIAVEDSGVGIAPEELLRIWDPFYQVEATMRRHHGGSGLGLALVRRLVELHGGVVRAESEGENRGSRFSFTLPLVLEDVTAEEPALEPATAIEPVLAGRRVLIVEDEIENQALMRAVVEDMMGAEAVVCGDGERALFEAVENPPALVLLDLMLPRVSGWEVARRLRQSPRTRDVPIVAVSALARAQEREAALHAGCNAYISKPFTPEDLVRIIAGTVMREDVPAR
jgi:signal transduction histidine kinase/ActR/RegA family two-component response regulator